MHTETALEEIIFFSDRIQEIGKGYFHSTPLSNTNLLVNGINIGEQVNMGLSDWGLIAAMSESPLRLLGDTDRGKTDFAKILMAALFGKQEQGWHKTDVDIDFGAMAYSGNDFSAISEGRTTDELFFSKPWLEFPGLIWDEVNRAPAKLLNKLLHVLEKRFTLENGKEIFAGHPYKREEEDARYQFHILTLNEGADFHGTSPVDRAFSRRQTIEIPYDLFQTSMLDKKKMGEKRCGPLDIQGADNNIERLLQLITSSRKIPISTEAEHLRLYLMSMDSCPHSMSGHKKGVKFSEHICQKAPGKKDPDKPTDTPAIGCHHLASYPNRMCPNIYSLGDGNTINLLSIAKAHALIRTFKVVEIAARQLDKVENAKSDAFQQAARMLEVNKFCETISEATGQKYRGKPEKTIRSFIEGYVSSVKVEPSDIYAVFPFVAYSKLQLNEPWVRRQYQGERWHAVHHIGETAYARATGFHNDHPELFHAMTNGNAPTAEQRVELQEICQNDLWLERSFSAYDEEKMTAQNPPARQETVRKILSR